MDLEINKSPYVQSLTVPRRGNAIPTLEQNSRKYTVLSKIKPHALLMSKKKRNLISEYLTECITLMNWGQNLKPALNYMFKFNNRNTRTRCEICSKLTMKTRERRNALHFTPCSSVTIVNFDQVSVGWKAVPVLSVRFSIARDTFGTLNFDF